MVASYGEGPGEYKSLIERTGKVTKYDGYDGAPYAEKVSRGKVRYLDLTTPQYGVRAYDWILCLEVAEHISRRFESIFLDNLFRHAREGIVLSWARPEQRGTAHLNNQPLDYVIKRMADGGFIQDSKASERLQSAAELKWLQNNVHVFHRKDKDTFKEEDV